MSIERNSVHWGDCFDLLPQLPDGSIDLIFCDLPYQETSNPLDKRIIMEDYIITRQRGKEVQLTFEQWCVHCIKTKIRHELCLYAWKEDHCKGLWSHFKRVLKKNGNVLLFAQGHFQSYLMQSNPKQYKYDIIWNKKLISNHLNAKNMPLRQHESILVFNDSIQKATYNPQFTTGKPLHSKGKNFKSKVIVNNNYGKVKHTDDLRKGSTDKYPTTIWFFPKTHPAFSEYKTEKPVELMVNGIKTYSNPGDVVLDVAGGSGPTAVAALLSGRDYILFDKSPEAIEKTHKRLSVVQTWI